MPKTHHEIIEETESRLLKAICYNDFELMYELVHDQVVYTNETGQVFSGIDNILINNPQILNNKLIEVHERTISFFNSVAIVNTFERRIGQYMELEFNVELSLTRIWKFHNQKWILIAASVVTV